MVPNYDEVSREAGLEKPRSSHSLSLRCLSLDEHSVHADSVGAIGFGAGRDVRARYMTRSLHFQPARLAWPEHVSPAAR